MFKTASEDYLPGGRLFDRLWQVEADGRRLSDRMTLAALTGLFAVRAD